MARKLFGTDGVRGRANASPMTPDVILRLAQAAGLEFKKGQHRHTVVIGKDTRLSGYMLEPALTAGFISVGMDVVLVGPLPTPAVAMLTRSLRADLGVMISASHNPYTDNGVKLFGPGGHKLSDEIELRIEQRMKDFGNDDLAPAKNLGRAKRLDDAPGRYIEFIKSTFPEGLRLDGLKIVIDCANGAAYKIAPTILWELGAEIIPIGVNPDGCNINLERGVTSPEAMQQAVIDHGANIGIALDGDADRVAISDEKGALVEGDHILAMISLAWKEQGLLTGDTVVTTVMSNLGFKNILESKGLKVIQTPVGDRYVGKAMVEHKCNLGGEPSGHVILGDYGSSGDGLLAALQVLAILVRSKKPASQICRVFNPVPQLLKNVTLKHPKVLKTDEVKKSLEAIDTDLRKVGGETVIRPSGTEPLVRVMVQGSNEKFLKETLQKIVDVLHHADKNPS
jgi:phosphoglucosamine mutase